MGESPMFKAKKEAGQLSKNPIIESFGNIYNLKYVMLALVGATMGQGTNILTRRCMVYVSVLCFVVYANCIER
jgi:hypothetical protein